MIAQKYAILYQFSKVMRGKRFNIRVVGIEKNPDSVAKARENIKAAGLSDIVTIFRTDDTG